MTGWLAGCLAGCLAGWVTGWLAGWVTGWLDDWMAGWLDGRLVLWLARWLVGWLAGSLAGRLVGWLANGLNITQRRNQIPSAGVRHPSSGKNAGKRGLASKHQLAKHQLAKHQFPEVGNKRSKKGERKLCWLSLLQTREKYTGLLTKNKTYANYLPIRF